MLVYAGNDAGLRCNVQYRSSTIFRYNREVDFKLMQKIGTPDLIIVNMEKMEIDILFNISGKVRLEKM